MADIDTALRFKIKNYLLNYSLICQNRVGDFSSENWVNYVEYGTTDQTVIALQTIGMPRHLANFIINEYPECVVIENNIVVSFQDKELKAIIDIKQFQNEYAELAEIFDW